MDPASIVDYIRTVAHDKGFSRVRFLSPYNTATIFGVQSTPDNHWEGAPSLLVVALPYGNSGIAGPQVQALTIAPFARRNYYAEAVSRLKDLAKTLRGKFGGQRSEYRILCNSPVPEKPIALLCGLGWPGKNSLIITPEAGSLVIIAAMTLPFQLPGDAPLPGVFPESAEVLSASLKRSMDDSSHINTHTIAFPACKVCGDNPACMNACPTGAIAGDGTVKTERCIQWYASGHGDVVPHFVADAWENQLYGCTYCQDVCPYNKKAIKGIETDRGKLPDYVTVEWILTASDEAIKNAIRGSALGMQWLGPKALRRNAQLVLRRR
jgi:epoxyqueuosine reductase